MPKTPEEALAEAMTNRASQTLGAQLMQIVQLQVQNEALLARVAELEAAYAKVSADVEAERRVVLSSAAQAIEGVI